MAYALTWLRQVLLDAGLKVAEQPGWMDRGRAEMGKVVGVICHHTVGPAKGNMPSLDTLTNGRPGTATQKPLAGPLCHLGLGRDGTFYVVAAGRANHAGEGVWQGVTNGNANFIGIEAENAGGVDDKWPDVQMDAYYRGVAAILGKIGADPIMCCGHKEYAPIRKPVDPRFDMNAFRAEVKKIMGGQAPAPTLIPAVKDGRNTLRRGDKGDDVKAIQAKVGVAADGTFGSATEAAVREFQRKNELVPDGIVGPKTWDEINKA